MPAIQLTAITELSTFFIDKKATNLEMQPNIYVVRFSNIWSFS